MQSERVMVRRHQDRVSASFSEDADDVPWIVTVTFDNNAVGGLDDADIVANARATLRRFT